MARAGILGVAGLPDMGVSENRGTLFGVLTIRILLFRVLY